MKLLKLLYNKEMISQYFALTVFGAISYTLFPGEIRHFWQSNWLYLVGFGYGTAGIFLWASTRNRSMGERLMTTIKNLETNIKIDGTTLWPKIIRRKKEEYGWEFILSVPEGLCEIDFLKHFREFETALNSEIEITENEGKIHFKVMTHSLPEIADFKEEWINVNPDREIESRGSVERL